MSEKTIRVLEVNVDDLFNGGVYALVKSVILQLPDNIRADIACYEPFENKKHIEELKACHCGVYYVGSKKNKVVKQWTIYRKTKALIRKKRYDIVHIHGDVSNKLFFSALAAKHCGVKRIILHSHAAGIDSNKKVALRKAVHMLLKPFLCTIGTDLIACSGNAARWMYLPSTKKKWRIIKNGVDPERFWFDEKVRKKMRAGLQLENSFVVGHVGRFSHAKNHDFILKLARQLKRVEPNVRILLVGTGELENAIKESANRMGLEDMICFYGTSDKVEDLYQAMDLFILPSRFEGFGLSGVEAQISGLPVICSKGCPGELAISGQAGFLPADDAHIGVWVDRIRHIKKERVNVERSAPKIIPFGMKETITSFVNLYQGAYD